MGIDPALCSYSDTLVGQLKGASVYCVAKMLRDPDDAVTHFNDYWFKTYDHQDFNVIN